MKEYKEFWIDVRKKIKKFNTLDDADVIFGARTGGWGHQYKTYPTMSLSEIKQTEKEKKITFPVEFKSYLLFFGAGGAGPDYGIEDLREMFANTEFDKPFIYNELSKITGEICDNEPIEYFSGLLYLGTAGCCTDYFIELLGNNVGNVWCNWGDGGCNSEGNLINFYSKWIDIVDVKLIRYSKLKELKNRFDSFFGKLKKLSFNEIVAQMDCKYSERTYDGSEYGAPQGQIWIYFEQTKGKVILNDNWEILRIEVGN